MSPIELASVLAAAGAVIGAFVAIFKISPERQSIIITAAQGAVIVQAGVIDDLQEQILSLQARIADYNQLRAENTHLRRRIDHLEDVVRRAGLDPG